MSHDLYAAWATTELAINVREHPENFYSTLPLTDNFSVYATRESGRKWPVSDGVIMLDSEGSPEKNLAVEFKQANEGLHGILTAIGQSHAYLHKGFSGSVIVIPSYYDSHATAAQHTKSILESTSNNLPIGLFIYDEPDTTQTSPFHGRLNCLKRIAIDQQHAVATASPIARVETLWGHVREGSTDPHALFCYLQVAKSFVIGSEIIPSLTLPPELIRECNGLSDVEPLKYLSNCTGDTFHDKVWRYFWFKYVFHNEAVKIWRTVTTGNYMVNTESSNLQQPDGSPKMFFVGRSDSIKNKLVQKLNARQINEQTAWNEYAQNVHNRAHSYREDIDSGLLALGLLEEDGKPTDLGYRFVDSCERTKTWNSGTPKLILGAALVQNANFGAFLHYIYKLSEDKLRGEPLAFSSDGENDSPRRFMQDEYRDWLEDKLANDLLVMRKVSVRGGQRRKPFQAELAILRQFNLVEGFRIGVGLEINWPNVQQALEFET